MSWVDGSLETITGSGFGTKSPVSPLVWSKLDSINNLGRGGVFDPGMNSVIAGAPSLSGKSCARWNIAYDNNGLPGQTRQDSNGFRITLSQPPNKLFLRGKKYLAFDPLPTQLKNHKTWRAVSGDNVNPWINWYASWGHSPEGDGRVSIEAVGEQKWNDTIYPIFQWNVEEWFYKKSTPGISDGILRFIQNKIILGNLDPCVNSLVGSGGITTFGSYDDASNVDVAPSPIPDWFIYYRDIYYDDTWTRIEIGNNSVYTSCSITEPQIPVSWSDSSISFTVNKGDLPTLEGMTLFVFNDQNQIVHQRQINSWTRQLTESVRNVGRTNFGPISIPDSATIANVRMSRQTSALSLTENVRATIEISFDNGNTWPQHLTVGMKNGTKLTQSGDLATHTSASTRLLHGTNRILRGNLNVLSQTQTGIEVSFD